MSTPLRTILASTAAALVLSGLPAAAQQSGEVLTKQYDDGGVYEGTFKNGLQDGKGTWGQLGINFGAGVLLLVFIVFLLTEAATIL